MICLRFFFPFFLCFSFAPAFFSCFFRHRTDQQQQQPDTPRGILGVTGTGTGTSGTRPRTDAHHYHGFSRAATASTHLSATTAPAAGLATGGTAVDISSRGGAGVGVSMQAQHTFSAVAPPLAAGAGGAAAPAAAGGGGSQRKKKWR